MFPQNSTKVSSEANLRNSLVTVTVQIPDYSPVAVGPRYNLHRSTNAHIGFPICPPTVYNSVLDRGLHPQPSLVCCKLSRLHSKLSKSLQNLKPPSVRSLLQHRPPHEYPHCKLKLVSLLPCICKPWDWGKTPTFALHFCEYVDLIRSLFNYLFYIEIPQLHTVIYDPS